MFRYLAHGGGRQLYSLSFRMGLTTVRRITLETCDIIWNVLSDIYLSVPNEEEWKMIAVDFEKTWNMPNCVGALNGKHVNITCPPNSGSMFYNYKGQYSIVLLGVCDANYTFTAVDVGAYGSQSDGGVFRASKLKESILNNNLGIPGNRTLPNSDITFPHYFVGDAAFPLTPYLMRPYPGKNLDDKKENFNKRLSRARRTIENAFGILTVRWRILRNTLSMAPENAKKIVKASVVLHNYLKLSDSTYLTPEDVDRYDGENAVDGSWRSEANALQGIGRTSSNRPSTNACELRNELKEYLFQNKI